MIGGFHPCSFIDFPGHLSAVVFTRGCNLRCRYCHNPELCSPSTSKKISIEELLCFFKSRLGKLKGVVVSGGEPTLHKKLPYLLETIKALGFAVKLDTNGTRPAVVRQLIADQLVDYVAVDVKTAPGSCSKWLCGVTNQPETALETLGELVKAKIPCEARTTAVSQNNDAKNLDAIARSLASLRVDTWRLQALRNETVLDPSVFLSPPRPGMLSAAVDTAKSLGMDAALRTTGSGIWI